MVDIQPEPAYKGQPTSFQNKKRYNFFKKCHKNMSMHLSAPCCRDVRTGDLIAVGECQLLSKAVCFNVPKVTKAAGTKQQF
ncbi:unnamed protein product [Nyctereutes procyonoides]|uniref:(raccoon dog) hypothetical protein n=1 Tax=Nyctereutes procyonoides TaxID=34880 RepID=A0A811YV92_NYCPR|nr:unnamed protein product [Nyctereutes procyonoides]